MLRVHKRGCTEEEEKKRSNAHNEIKGWLAKYPFFVSLLLLLFK